MMNDYYIVNTEKIIQSYDIVQHRGHMASNSSEYDNPIWNDWLGQYFQDRDRKRIVRGSLPFAAKFRKLSGWQRGSAHVTEPVSLRVEEGRRRAQPAGGMGWRDILLR
jgi:hypothetical protein